MRPHKAPGRWLLPQFLTLLGVCAITLALLSSPANAQDIRSHQWYLDAMRAEDMWKVSAGEGITVAVIDDGIDTTVAELQGQTLPNVDAYGKETKSKPKPGSHGTNMAIAIAGRQEGDGIIGLAPRAKVLPIFAFSEGLNRIPDAIRHAADRGAQVINISIGGYKFGKDRSELMSAVTYANKKGSLIFAGTGNDAKKGNAPSSPSDIPGVVGVGAIDKSLDVAEFSTYGPQVALVAPGVGIPSRCAESAGYCTSNGTSPATALASASAALIWSAHPDWTNNQVLRVMLETAGKPDDGKVPNTYLGYGSIRPRKVLLDGEGNPGDPNVNPLPSAQAPSMTPSPAATGKEGDATKDTSQPSFVTADGTDSGGVPIWIVLASVGVVAAVAIGVGVRIARGRQRTT